MRDTGEYLFTSESVSEGHPDKVADRISDTVLDAYLTADPYSRVACETLVTTNRVVLAGEVRGPGSVTPEYLMHLARLAIHDIGYEQDGFHWQTAEIACHLHAQSEHIAMGVDAAGNKDEGAGDQGIMFGYACTETPDLMPAPLYYAHTILRRVSELRRITCRTRFCPKPHSPSFAARWFMPGASRRGPSLRWGACWHGPAAICAAGGCDEAMP